MQHPWNRLRIKREDPRPPFEQIVVGVRHLIATGVAENGAPLPPLRAAAEAWGVNLHTVRRAYQELERLGLIEIRGTRGAVVTTLARVALDPPFEEFLGEVASAAQERFGKSVEDLIAGLDALRHPSSHRPRVVVWVLECSESFRESIAAQLRRHWGADARGWDVAMAESVPPGHVISTYFHYEEVRTKLVDRLRDVHFIGVHYEPEVIRKAARAARAADGELLVCNRDPSLTPLILDEIRQHVPRDVRVVESRVVRPGALLEEDAGPPVLFTPPLWDRLSEAERRHPRAFSLAVVVDAPALELLGRTLALGSHH